MTEMTTTREAGQLATQHFTREQIDLLKRTIAKDHTDDELKLFLAYCQSRGLDPFAREVYSVKRAGKVTIQTGIDGLRKKAEETGEYDGSEVYWCDGDGIWVDVWLKNTPPAAARVVIYRRGSSKPYVGIARWDEYKPADNDWMWRKMPANQLAKCAEALALRKAFPGKLGGLYSTDEMKQSETPAPEIQMPKARAAPTPVVSSFDPDESGETMDPSTGEVVDAEPTEQEPPPELEPPPMAPRTYGGKRLTPKQQAFLFGLAKKKGWEEYEVKMYTERFFQKSDPTELTSAELDKVLMYLKQLPDAGPVK